MDLKKDDIQEIATTIILLVAIILTISFIVGSMITTRNKVKFLENEVVKVKEQVVYRNFPNKYIGEFEISHYCSCPKCTGTSKGSRTYTGSIPRQGRTVAVDTKVIPLHSIIYIEDLGYFVAEDKGSAVQDKHIDIYTDSHEDAINKGTLNGELKKVYVLQSR